MTGVVLVVYTVSMTKTTTTKEGTMFVQANHSLGAFVTSADYSHSLCVRATVRGKMQLHRLYGFESYDAALAAYEAAVEYNERRDREAGDEKRPGYYRDHFAVRSMFDLNIEVGLVSDEFVNVTLPYRVVANGLAAMVRREYGETAAWLLRNAERHAENTGGGATWEGLMKQGRESLEARGFKFDRFRLEDALKSRVRIGRCHECSRRTAGWFWKSSTKARVADVRCPVCHSRLYQTTLAFNATFRFIANPVETFFATNPNLLPGEKQADAEARLDRVHEAMEV